MTEKTMTAK